MSDQSGKVTSWLVRGEGQQREVGSLDDLKAEATAGTLKGEHYVFHPQKQQWLYANQVPELRGIYARVTQDPSAWIIKQHGETKALKSLDDVRKWIDDYRIDRTTPIRNPLLGRWMTAGDVLELHESFARRPEIQFTPEPQRSLLPAMMLGAFAALVMLGVFGLLREKPTVRRPVTPVTTTTTATPDVPEAAPPPRPRKIHTITFGPHGEEITGDSAATTATSTSTATTTTTKAAAAPAAPATTTQSAETHVPRPPVRDEAEADDYDDEDMAVRGNDAIRVTPSGDTLVVIDRSGRDPYYHRPGCPAAKGDLSTVSLDLAKQGHSPDPKCRPPA